MWFFSYCSKKRLLFGRWRAKRCNNNEIISINFMNENFNTKLFFTKEGNGNVVLFLHGWGCNGNIFCSIYPKLKNYTTVKVDLWGFGKTELPTEFLDKGMGVVDYADKLQNYFGDRARVSYLHGKMKPALKNLIMEDFAAKNIDILVSTTVIEVGINVPNATVMMVENAERFGLAQLHQLRGRVGRGKDQSYCIFVNGNQNDKTAERLELLNKSNDGFFLANEDMRLRGPGDIFGIRQSGDFVFQVGDIYNDSAILLETAALADEILQSEKKEKLFPLLETFCAELRKVCR